jgi:hypothetical protein
MDEATTFLRNTIAGSPEFAGHWSVIGIESSLDGHALELFLDNGDTIAIDVTVYHRHAVGAVVRHNPTGTLGTVTAADAERCTVALENGGTRHASHKQFTRVG